VAVPRKGRVSGMTAEHGGSRPDLYELLGVDRGASREEIVRAWRRRARAEHPDSRPRDAAAPARFRALAEAYRVLGDPARRAAYDRAAGSGPRPRAVAPDGPPTRVPVARRTCPGAPVALTPLAWVPEAPLRAGPVRVENPYQVPAGGSLAGEEAMLAELALWYLAGGWGRPW
jgi:DnaJ domain